MNPGDRYGRYQVIRQLGRGAMGEVYLARDIESQRQIALKVVYKGNEPEDQDVVDAERLGAELQKRLSGADRRVVIVNRYGEITGDLFIEMEYIDGEDLSSLISRGPLPAGFATHVGVELCEMLENLSAFATTIGDREFRGVIHGDLKPRNVRINRQNQVKVIDFGIAKALSHTRKYTINLFASTAYSSPERLETQNIDSHSDLWSVGVMLYQMLSGKLPFDDTSKEHLERRIRSTVPPEPLPAECPEQIARIAFKMLSRDQARRYRSATEMKDDLTRFRRGEPVLAEPVPVFSEADATVRTTGPVTGPPPPSDDDGTVRTTSVPPAKEPPIMWPPKRKRSQRTGLGCLIASAVAGFLLVGWVALQLNFWNEAEKLKSDIDTERVTNVEEALKRYDALSKRMHMGILLWGAQNAVKRLAMASANDTILDFRNADVPSVTEDQWVQARNTLARALQIDFGDKQIRGDLRLSEGHIDRIEGARQKGPNRNRLLNAAITKFTEAADLLKNSPDPYLGMARIYVYDQPNVEKAEETLNEAAKYGHPMGKRETVQLAYAYQKRADNYVRQSRRFVQTPDQEREYLTKARQDYIHARDLYDQVGLFSDAIDQRKAVSDALDQVDQELNGIPSGL